MVEYKRVRIEKIERLACSAVGNPRFRIQYSTPGWTSYHSGITKADASFNYEIGNRGFRERDVVLVKLNGNGNILDMKVVPVP